MARNKRAVGVARVVSARRAPAERLRQAAEDILADQMLTARVGDITCRMGEAGGADRTAMNVEDLLGSF